MISIVESLDCGSLLQRSSESFDFFVALIGTLASLTLKFSISSKLNAVCAAYTRHSHYILRFFVFRKSFQ